jgi:diguanylate cyclase (GGDEF)-like protein/PAS domain S-box-containing protein
MQHRRIHNPLTRLSPTVVALGTAAAGFTLYEITSRSFFEGMSASWVSGIDVLAGCIITGLCAFLVRRESAIFNVRKTAATENTPTIRRLKSLVEESLDLLAQVRSFEAAASDLLSCFGEALQAERCALFLYPHDPTAQPVILEWSATQAPLRNEHTYVQLMGAPGAVENLRSGQPVRLERTTFSLPEETRALLEQYTLNTLVIAPLTASGQVNGFLWVENPVDITNAENDLFEVLRAVGKTTGLAWRYENMKNLYDEQSQLFREVLDTNPNPIFAKDSQGNYTLANRALADLLEAPIEKIIGKQDADLHPVAEEVDAMRQDDICVVESRRDKIVAEQPFTDSRGQKHWLRTIKHPVLNKNGAVSQVINISTDITERKRAEERSVFSSLHDTLTSLPNRTLFLDRLGRAVRRVKRHKALFAVLYLDFDNFKKVNDSLGRLIGDQLLISASQKLTSCIRGLDTVARIGGDEFAVLLEDLNDTNEAVKVAQRILEKMDESFSTVNRDVFLTTSIGIVFVNATYHNDPLDVMRDADIAMYRAKALGKSRYVVFNENMRVEYMGRLQMETDLRLGIERQELRLFYQPILAVGSGQIVGFEALVRWLHPKRGLISPSEFIPIAEETDLIIPMGNWVLREACKQTRLWHERFPRVPPLTVSVNISSKQLTRSNFEEQVAQALRESDLRPDCLKLEITESVFMENFEAVTQVINQLHLLGVQVFIDDFGTGYSSLSYLHHFPIDAVKIDRSFISSIDNERGGNEIVQAILKMSQGLGMRIIAEGVETAAQHSRLKTMGCEYEQGFLISRPLAPEEFERFFAV